LADKNGHGCRSLELCQIPCQTDPPFGTDFPVWPSSESATERRSHEATKPRRAKFRSLRAVAKVPGGRSENVAVCVGCVQGAQDSKFLTPPGWEKILPDDDRRRATGVAAQQRASGALRFLGIVARTESRRDGETQSVGIAAAARRLPAVRGFERGFAEWPMANGRWSMANRIESRDRGIKNAG
jgi:hypothetical protein